MFKKSICLILVFALFMGFSFNFSNLVENYSSILTPINNAVEFVKSTTGLGLNNTSGNQVHLLNGYVYNYDSSRQISFKDVLYAALPKSNAIYGIKDVEILALNPKVYNVSYNGGTSYTAIRLTLRCKEDKTFFKAQTVDIDCLWLIPFIDKEADKDSIRFPMTQFSGVVHKGLSMNEYEGVKTHIFNYISDVKFVPVIDFNHIEYAKGTTWLWFQYREGSIEHLSKIKLSESNIALADVINLCVDNYQII